MEEKLKQLEAKIQALKFLPKQSRKYYEQVPKELIKSLYDSDDRLLFGSHTVKGLVTYSYIPASNMMNGIDYIIGTSISYDGVGLAGIDRSKDEVMSFSDLPKRFTKNKFKL